MKAWTYLDGRWVEGNPPVLGPMSHATWLSSIIFDGARAFEGVTPDLDLHCARAVRSAENMLMKPMLSAGEIEEICREGVRKFPKDAELYIRPMFFAEGGWIDPDPATTRFMCSVYESPLPRAGFSACVSQFRRPSPETAPTDAKASCLYPLAGRIMMEAKTKGFDNAVVRDLNGNVAEFATANLFFVKDSVVHTPILNGTFLPGVTRARIIDLLRKSGQEVQERTVKVKEVLEADEIFSSGNYAKVQPCTRMEDRHLQPGPVYKRARELYWEYAHRTG
jgi:branched-chain amino acid aminotransferase